MRRLKNIPWECWLLTLVSAMLIFSSGPVYGHPDSVVPYAIQTMNSGMPYFYHYPGLVIYANAFEFGIARIWDELVIGERTRPERFDTLQTSRAATIEYDLPARIMTGFFSLIGILSTYAITLWLTKKRLPATLSALTLASSPLWFRDSHFATVDIPLAAICALAVATLVYHQTHDRPITANWLLLFGILLGAATATKYNGALIGIIFLIPLIHFGHKNIRLLTKQLTFIALVALGIFLICNPTIFVQWYIFTTDLVKEFTHVQSGDIGYQSIGGSLGYHLRVNLPLAMGILPYIVGLFGLALYTFKYRKFVLAAILISFPVFYLIVIGFSPIHFMRYVLPAIPVLAVGVGLLFFELQNFLHRHSCSPLIIITSMLIGAGGLLLPAGVFAARFNTVLKQVDTRIQLMQILESSHQQLPPTYAGGYTGTILAVHTKDGTLSKNVASASLAIIDSFSSDRLIYDESGKRSSQMPPLEKFSNGSVLIISPFVGTKATTPIAPESLYGPFYPDIWYRSAPGPYIELYSQTKTELDPLFEACLQLRIDCIKQKARDGYYYRQLVDTR